MRVLAIVSLTLLCVLGRVVLRWRRVARSGFGTGLRTNVPRAVRHGGGNAIVWLFGHIAWLGAPAVLLFFLAWYWALLAIFLAGGLEHIVLILLWKDDVEEALKFRREHQAEFDELKRLEGRDPLDDALN